MTGGHASTMRTVLTRAGRANPVPQLPLRRMLSEQRELAAERDRTSPLATLRHYAVTTPGKLVLIMVALVIACLSTGWYASSVLDRRTQTLQLMVDRAEPLAEAAQVLYSSLSVADASANSAFISGGLESPELRTRYSDAIATASSSLIIASGSLMAADAANDQSSVDDATRADVQTLATSIPVYAGLIETARTNNRLGNPVGSAYLGQASTLMQDHLLPAAQRLYEQRSAAIADPQRTLTVPPWGVYTALIVLIVALVLTSRYLAKRVRRRFNIGVVAALIAVVVGTVWLLASGLMSVAATNNAKVQGADPLRDLTSARILTQQARSAETLSLVRRGDQTSLEQTFTQSTDEIDKILASLRSSAAADGGSLTQTQLTAAADALGRWKDADAAVRAEIQSGDFATARMLTVGTDAISSARSFGEVDAALVDGITTTRAAFRDDINTAQRVIGFTGTGIMVLAVFAALALAGGLIPRIREYR